MQTGAVLPQTEMPVDAASIRDFAQALQDLGYEHLITSDHVVGANPDGHPGWTRPQRHTTVVHEPFGKQHAPSGCGQGLGEQVVKLP